jgi:alkylhydroperoxidase family enzyme
MRLKSAYRPEKLADNIPAEAPEPPQPSETTHIEFTNNKADPSVGIIVGADEIPQPDEATFALQKQLADLRKSEELQREYCLARHGAARSAPEDARRETIGMASQRGRRRRYLLPGISPGDD